MIIWGAIALLAAFGALGMGSISGMVLWAAVGSVLIAYGIHRNRQRQSQTQQQTVIVNNYTAPPPAEPAPAPVPSPEPAPRPAVSPEMKHESLEEFQKRLDDRQARMEEDNRRFVRLRFPVAGVTFQNEDKTDRQKILREIVLNNDGIAEVSFSENEKLGDDSGIEVITEYGCVGFVRRSDKAKIRRFFDKTTHSVFLSAERFENDEGQKIYRADVCINIDRDDPDQRWYFNDLPEC